MKITIESTEDIALLDGVMVRRWRGVTERGTACELFVHRVVVRNSEDNAEFAKELREQLAPGRVIDTRYVV